MAPGWGENLFRCTLLPEPDGTGLFYPHPWSQACRGGGVEQPDSSRHPVSGGSGRGFGLGTLFYPRSPRMTWHTFLEGAAATRHPSRLWQVAGPLGLAVGFQMTLEEADGGSRLPG